MVVQPGGKGLMKMSGVLWEAAGDFAYDWCNGKNLYICEPNRIVRCTIKPEVLSYLDAGGKIPEGIVYYRDDLYCYGPLAVCLEFLEKLGVFENRPKYKDLRDIVYSRVQPLDIQELDCWKSNEGTFAYARSAEIVKLTGVPLEAIQSARFWIPSKRICVTPEQALMFWENIDLVEDDEKSEFLLNIILCDWVTNNEPYDLNSLLDRIRREREQRIFDIALRCFEKGEEE